MRSARGMMILIVFICSIIIFTVGVFKYSRSVFSPVADNNIKSDRQGCHEQFRSIETDSEGRLYLGFMNTICVYSPTGAFLYELDPPSMVAFEIKDDLLTVYIHRSNEKYVYTLDGDLIETGIYTYEDPPHFARSSDAKIYAVNGKIEYRLHSILGIWYLADSRGKMLAHIPLFLAFFKTAQLLLFICVSYYMKLFLDYCLKDRKEKTGAVSNG